MFRDLYCARFRQNLFVRVFKPVVSLFRRLSDAPRLSDRISKERMNMHAITPTRKFNPFDQAQPIYVHMQQARFRHAVFIFARVLLSSLISRLLGLKRGHQMSIKCQKKRIATIFSISKFEIFFCYKSAVISHNGS